MPLQLTFDTKATQEFDFRDRNYIKIIQTIFEI